jgi:hypothetical protein
MLLTTPPRTMKTMITPNSSSYNEIIEFLRKQLNLPDQLIEINLSIKVGEPIVVTTTYYPRKNPNA